MSNGVGNIQELLGQAGGLLGQNAKIPNVDLGKADGLLDDIDIGSLLAAASLDTTDKGNTGDPLKDYTFGKSSDPMVEIVQQRQAAANGKDGGHGENVRHTNTGSRTLDTDMPDFMQEMTGMATWDDMAKVASGTMLKGFGALTGVPAVGALLGGIADSTALDDDEDFTGLEAFNVAEDVGFAISGLTPLTAIAEGIAESAEVYDAQDGIINSIMDTWDAVVNGVARPSTLSGWVAAGGTKTMRDRIMNADAVADNRESRYVSSNLAGYANDPTAQDRADFATGDLEGPVQESGSSSDQDSGRDKDGGSSRPDRDGPSGDSQGTGSANNER